MFSLFNCIHQIADIHTSLPPRDMSSEHSDNVAGLLLQRVILDLFWHFLEASTNVYSINKEMQGTDSTVVTVVKFCMSHIYRKLLLNLKINLLFKN